MRRTGRQLLSVLVVLLSRNAGAQASTPPAAPVTTGTLTGVVKDTAGRTLNDVDVSIPDLARATRSDSTGSFLLAQITPGVREVWIRKLGYIAVQFEWPAAADTRISIAVTLRPLPHTLDAVVVWASEEKTIKARSIVRGFVVDSAGEPINGAEVSLLGSGRATVTLPDGSFAFRHVAAGPLTIRARLMGHTPSVARIDLLADDDRKVYLRMGNLPQMLDEQRITAMSGFGPEAMAWKDFDERSRWHINGSSQFFGPTQMALWHGIPLDYALRGVGSGFTRPATSGGRGGHLIEGDVCILENGLRPITRPLSAYHADQVEMIEYYPPAYHMSGETEFTNTVVFRMSSAQGCAGEPGTHPAYFVIWLKGSK